LITNFNLSIIIHLKRIVLKINFNLDLKVKTEKRHHSRAASSNARDITSLASSFSWISSSFPWCRAFFPNPVEITGTNYVACMCTLHPRHSDGRWDVQQVATDPNIDLKSKNHSISSHPKIECNSIDLERKYSPNNASHHLALPPATKQLLPKQPHPLTSLLPQSGQARSTQSIVVVA
jgi:hypothetical protein